MKRKIFFKSLLVAACLLMGWGSTAWADELCSLTLTGTSTANATGCTYNLSGVQGASNIVTVNDVDYYKLGSDGAYVQLKLTSGDFRAGDVLTATVTSNGGSNSKTVNLKVNTTATSTVSVKSSEAKNITYTLTAGDIESDGSIKIYRGTSSASNVRVAVFSVSGSRATKLSTPSITYNTSTLEVTIGDVANALKVTYTTDGTTPTASSTTYSSPFVVADGTTVKAIAIGDGATYSNSNIASTTVYEAVDIATPVIKEVNGTVAITCATPGATVKYTTDDWTSETTYTKAFTLSADATVKAKAVRTGSEDSDVATADVTVVTSTKTKTLKMGYGSFTASGDNKTLTGKSGDDAEGFTLTFNDDSKTWGSGNKFTSPINKTAIKNSNGAGSILTMPDNIAATKLTLYSYVNVATASASSTYGWKTVGGVSYESGDTDYKNIPMGTFNDTEDRLTNQDVRVYPLDNVTGSLSFVSAGQMCFVFELDVIEYVKTMKVQYKSGETLIKEESIDVTPLTKQVGSSETIPFRMYIEKDGALYQTTKESSNPYYGKSTTLTKNTVLERSVTSVNLNGGTIELFEDLDGSISENANIRASNCSAYNNTAYTSTIDLPAGVYNFIVKAQNKGRGSSVKVGDQTVFTIADVVSSTGSWADNTITDVVVPVAGKLSFVKGGNNSIDCYDILIAIRQAAPASVSGTITASGYNTFSSIYPLDLSTIDGGTAYVASSIADGKVVLTKVDDKIVASGTGLFIAGTAGETFEINTTSADATFDGTNLFVGMPVGGTVAVAEEGEYNYVFGWTDASNPGFYKVASDLPTLDAGKAYLHTTTALDVAAARLGIAFEEMTTGISEKVNVNSDKFATAPAYNLQGQRIAQPTKGLYIKNGKKIMVK